jgi:hypothetical protein
MKLDKKRKMKKLMREENMKKKKMKKEILKILECNVIVVEWGNG